SRHIYNKLLTVRSRLLAEVKNKKQFLSQWNYQKIPCIEMVKKPVHQCPCIPPSGCYMWRSKYEIPEPLTSNFRHVIQYVSNLSGSEIFDETIFPMVKYRSGNKYTSQRNEFFFENRYLWIISKKNETGEDEMYRVVSLSALFEDPSAVEQFIDFCKDGACKGCCPEDDCTSMLDKEFPLDNDLIERAVLMAMQELIELPAKLTKEDASSDTRDNLTQESK
ncbi:MAG: hypothetical protein GWN64_04140, partial [Candidatus Thorarchaeota archaeon]|nr:hypothetical protein [Candidatus Thorarchaeota archaeon]